MANQLTINGQVTLTHSTLPISGARIELWDSTGTYGWLGSTVTDTEGNFNFKVNDPSIDLNGISHVVPQYKVFKENILISTQTIASYTGTVSVNITEDVYDTEIVDKQTDVSPLTYITLQGTVKDQNNEPIPNTAVNIYENGFREKTLITSTSTNLSGQYSARISSRFLGNSVVSKSRSIRIEVTDTSNNVIASSPDIFDWQDPTVIDLQADTVSALTKYARISAAITGIIGGAAIASLTIDASENVDEISYVSNASGENIDDVKNIVAANQYGGANSMAIDLYYALVNIQGNNSDPLQTMNEQQLRDAIGNAIATNIIGSHVQSTIDTFISQAKTVQINYYKATTVTGETYTMNDVLNHVVSNQTTVDNFLTAYHTLSYDSIDDFWTMYATTYGTTLANKFQLGLKLCAITFYQPQTIASIIAGLGTNHISTLATWDLSTWSDLISNNCTNNSLLCVPSPIRGSENDPTNSDVQLQYAKKLLTITQNMYPLAHVSGQLQGDNGANLISDDTLRNNVVTFLGNNPEFDLRVTSIHDINSNDHDLSHWRPEQFTVFPCPISTCIKSDMWIS